MEVETSDPAKEIELAAAGLPKPLRAVRAPDGRIINDGSCITVSCDKNHIHQIYLRDIDSAKCKTCTFGNEATKRVRAAAEKVFGAPFVILETKGPSQNCIFYNLPLRVAVRCPRRIKDAMKLAAGAERSGEKIMLSVPAHNSGRVRNHLISLINEHADWFDPALVERVNKIPHAKLGADGRPKGAPGGLPYPVESAMLMGRPFTISDTLYFENCFPL